MSGLISGIAMREYYDEMYGRVRLYDKYGNEIDRPIPRRLSPAAELEVRCELLGMEPWRL